MKNLAGCLSAKAFKKSRKILAQACDHLGGDIRPEAFGLHSRACNCQYWKGVGSSKKKSCCLDNFSFLRFQVTFNNKILSGYGSLPDRVYSVQWTHC